MNKRLNKLKRNFTFDVFLFKYIFSFINTKILKIF